MGDDAAPGDGRLDESVQLLVSSDGQLQMPWGDPLHLQILGRVASQLEHLSSEVLKDGRAVDSRGGSNPSRGEGPALQMTMDPSNGNWSPALALLETAFCFTFPESFPAFPPAILSFEFHERVSVATDEFKLPC